MHNSSDKLHHAQRYTNTADKATEQLCVAFDCQWPASEFMNILETIFHIFYHFLCPAHIAIVHGSSQWSDFEHRERMNGYVITTLSASMRWKYCQLCDNYEIRLFVNEKHSKRSGVCVLCHSLLVFLLPFPLFSFSINFIYIHNRITEIYIFFLFIFSR